MLTIREELTYLTYLNVYYHVYQEVRKAKWRHIKDVAVKTMQEGAMSEQDFIDEAKTMK